MTLTLHYLTNKISNIFSYSGRPFPSDFLVFYLAVQTLKELEKKDSKFTKLLCI